MTMQSEGRAVESRLTAALADTARRNLPDATVPPPFREAAEPGRVRSWALPALVAAVVVAITVGAVALTRGGSGRVQPAKPGSFVTLRAQWPLSSAQLRTAQRIIRDRAAVLGARNADVRIVGADEITASLPGVARADASVLAAVGALQFRPVIGEPISVPGPSGAATAIIGPPSVVDPWRSLGFAPPADAAAFNALSASQQQAVRAVLHGWDCYSWPLQKAGAPIIACDKTATTRYLLGPAIVASDQIGAATAVNVSHVGGQGWGVVVSMTTAGQRQWAAYTQQHNEIKHPGDQANVFAETLDSRVISASTIEAAITGPTEIVNDLSQHDATLLAGILTAGMLPAPFGIESVESR